MRTFLICAAALIWLPFTQVMAQRHPYLVKDIDPGVERYEHFQTGFGQLNGFTLAIGSRRDTGQELWRTDGTPDGTRIVKDICPGPCSSSISDLTLAGNAFYFFADNGAIGKELWRSDGSEAGTYLVRDIVLGPPSSYLYPLEVTAIGARLFFSAYDATHGMEPWTSDGTAEGTRLLRDIRVGLDSSSPYDFARVNDFVVFATKSELWRTDGTEEGTVLVANLGSIQQVTSAGSLAFFTATDTETGRELWRTDGTPGGTFRLADIAPGPPSSSPSSITRLTDGIVVFAATSPSLGEELWRSDGTTAGTVPVKDIWPGTIGSDPAAFHLFGHRVYFSARQSLWSMSFDLWATDGTEGGTVLVAKGAGPVRDYGRPAEWTEFDGRLYFLSSQSGGQNLWRTDGTAGGTSSVLISSSDPAVMGLTALPDRMVYVAPSSEGYGLWSTNGTEKTKITDPAADPVSSVSFPLLGSDGGLLYFNAAAPPGGSPQLWTSDGTAAGTKIFAPTGRPSPYMFGTLTRFRNQVFFIGGRPPGSACDGANRVWRTDGTSDGTYPIAPDPPPASAPCMFPEGASNLTATTEYLFFTASAYRWSFIADDIQLFRSDGTAEGSVPVKWVFASKPKNLTPVGPYLYFNARDGLLGRELLRTDGTAENTTVVADINVGYASSNPFCLTPVGLSLFFAANDGIHGPELWRTDGTSGETSMVKDIRPGKAGSVNEYTTQLAVLRDTVLFFADDGIRGTELWRSDGTEAGTYCVKDIWPGPGSSGPFKLVSLGGVVYFTANDSVNGAELWRSDGTTDGTQLVKDLTPEPGKSSCPQLWVTANRLFLTAWTPELGTELWTSDGIGKGTYCFFDLNPGPSSSAAGSPVIVDDKLFFIGDDGSSGSELWSLQILPFISGVSPGTAQPYQQITISGSGFWPATRVFINGVAAVVQVIDFTTLIVTVPNLPPGPASIEVVTEGGRATAPDSLQILVGTAIPAMTEWGLLFLLAALIATALRGLRERGRARRRESWRSA